MAYEFHLPDIGEGLHEAEVLAWLVAPGDVISADQPVALVQTDKAAVEIASPVGGKVAKLGAKVGQMISVGSLLVAIETNVTAETAATGGEGSAYAGGGAHEAAHTQQGTHRHKVLAAPAVRKYARDRGVDLTQVTPLDPAGRVTRLDIDRYLTSLVDENEFIGAAATSAVSVVMAERSNKVVTSAEEERVPIRGLRKRIYENMVRSATTVPQVTGMDDLDATELVRLRDRLLPFAKEAGIKLTYLPFIIKAVTHTLHAFPIFNAFVDDKAMEIVYQKQIHIGIATATPEGLIVPVVKHANQKSIFAIAAELEDLARRGRERKLTYKELTGSTFTITSTGANGGWFATPIVNHPEVAILGAHAIMKKAAVLPDDTIVAQQRMGFSLTFDHRVIDGEPAGAFMHKFKELVEHPELLLAL
jgi:pyruvate dehydrogenase E2 component (dihydrolipoamide acetyltransferase)